MLAALGFLATVAVFWLRSQLCCPSRILAKSGGGAAGDETPLAVTAEGVFGVCRAAGVLGVPFA